MRGFFVTGTDTGVGKTVVTAALAYCMKKAGSSVAVMKPVQTGTDSQEVLDIEFTYSVLGRDFEMEAVCPYRLSKPLAPCVASKIEGRAIDILNIIDLYNQLADEHDIVIVEGAGGLMAPITDGFYMRDLALEIGLPLIVVARPGLGTINHVLLTVESAASCGLEVYGVVISGYPDDPNLPERTNPGLLKSVCSAPIVGVLKHIEGLSVEAGTFGDLRDAACASFVNDLGGSFVLEEFLSKTSML